MQGLITHLAGACSLAIATHHNYTAKVLHALLRFLGRLQ